jgi:hypothetical protein
MTMQNWIDRNQTAFRLIGFPMYVGALWCFVCAILSYIGGVDDTGKEVQVEGGFCRRIVGVFRVGKCDGTPITAIASQ